MDRFLVGNGKLRSAMALALLFNDLTLGYDRLPAVQNLQAEIAVCSTAIVGPNGAGKSTLFKGRQARSRRWKVGKLAP